MPPLPTPTLDHVVVNLRDRLDEGLETFQRLGFAMTPRGHHSLGSVNHLAIFGTEYLELLAIPLGETKRPEILAAPVGLHALVFGTEDTGAVYASLRAAGVAVDPPVEFSRPVELAGGGRDATFRTVNLKLGGAAPGRLYFCHHVTRDLVWRDEWRHHPNGVVGIARAVIATREPDALGALFGRMFGQAAVRHRPDGCSLVLGLSDFEMITPAALVRDFEAAAPDAGGRASFMAVLTLRTTSLDRAAAALAAGRIEHRHEANRIVVAAASACGVALEFRA